MLKSARDVAILVAAAAVVGFILSRIASPHPATAPAPSREPVPTVAAGSPPPSPEPLDDDRVWQQPLAAGCVTDTGQVFLVSAGGGIARFDGAHWSLVDDTLRQLRAALCLPGLVVAVGDGGRIVRIDPLGRTIRPDVVARNDLLSVGAVDAHEIYAGGADLLLTRLHEGRWESSDVPDSGLSWRAVLVRSPAEVWLAGDGGRLAFFDGKRFVDRSIAEGPDLTALALFGSDILVGAADGRLFAAAPGRRVRQVARANGYIRGLVGAPDGAFVLSDDLRHVSASGVLDALPQVPACSGIAVFAGPRGELWVLGRNGASAGLLRYDGATWTKMGRC